MLVLPMTTARSHQLPNVGLDHAATPSSGMIVAVGIDRREMTKRDMTGTDA